jgi:hypothetical protein
MSKVANKPVKKVKHKKNTVFKIIMAILFAILLTSCIFFGYKYYKLEQKYQNILASQAAYNEVREKQISKNNDKTIKSVAKLIELPKNETPKIFEVQDKDKLGQAKVTKMYFANSQEGDVILAYEKANISVIYRPSENRVIKSDNYNNFYAAANPIKIAIIAPGKQQQETENMILSKVINADIISKMAPKIVSNQSIVVDASGQNSKAAKDLAEKIGLTVGQLPEGEPKPQGALLIVYMATPANIQLSP